MGPGDPLVVPREFRESTAAAVDRAVAADGHIGGTVGIDQLNRGRYGAQRDVVGSHGGVVGNVSTAVKRRTVFKIVSLTAP